MKERPILFSAPMVRAILNGRKMQTRRIIKGEFEHQFTHPEDGLTTVRHNGKPYELGDFIHERCPYGQPGDLLWVRETWYCDDYRVQFGPYLKPQDWSAEDQERLMHFRADDCDIGEDIWKPSIHMPRWASRITLEVVSVRVERLQDISVEDAKAEGCEHPLKSTELEGVPGHFVADERTSFAILWQSINGPGSWDANPWVWVVEFKTIG